MKIGSNILIRQKLMAMIMVVSSTALILSGILMIMFQVITVRARMANNHSMHARLIADNCLAAVYFNDPTDAATVIKTLSRVPAIVYASVARGGKILAEYRREGFTSQPESPPGKRRQLFRNNWLILEEPVIVDKEDIGSVYLQVDMQEMSEHRNRLVLVTFGTIVAILFVAYGFSSMLQRIISAPIEHLIETATNVSRSNDYSIRATHSADDELGQLAQAFNDMLSEVENRDTDLEHLRNYLDNIINSMPSILIGVDKDTIVTLWNQEATRATSLSAKEATGQKLSDVLPELAEELSEVHEAIRTRSPQSRGRVATIKNGDKRFSDLTVYPLVTTGVEGAVIRVDDVTDRVRIQEIIVQSEKMLTVGGLAAGMAHEINNPLSGMMQTANVMSNRLGAGSEAVPANEEAAKEAGTTMSAIRQFMEARGILRMITTINESGTRVSDIVTNMLNFVRKSEATVSPNDLADLVEKTLELASTDYDLKKHYDFKSITIKREYEDNLPLVRCDSGKIQQVLLNVLGNGAQAMRQAGTSNPTLTVRIRTEKPESMVRIEVEDSGPGMDEETQKHIFEPFYTTKPTGEGTGLGLSVSYFIITENHDGRMFVESPPGAGAKFVIQLPMERSAS